MLGCTIVTVVVSACVYSFIDVAFFNSFMFSFQLDASFLCLVLDPSLLVTGRAKYLAFLCEKRECESAFALLFVFRFAVMAIGRRAEPFAYDDVDVCVMYKYEGCGECFECAQ